ncbi:MAG: DUF2752 domain-containing protein [Planctomycetota bacterium]
MFKSCSKEGKITVVIIIVYFLYLAVSLNFSSFFEGIKCPFYTITKIPCAGCGATRAIHSLFKGDLLSAVHDNILAVLLFPLLFIFLIAPDKSKFLEKPPYSFLFIFTVAIFFIVRAILVISKSYKLE